MTTGAMQSATLAYVNIFITDFQRSLAFYRDTLGFEVVTEDEAFGYASFATSGAMLAIARVEADQASLAGRHTGIGWTVADVDESYQAMQADGVEFEMPPEQQPWGGYMAIFKDPDGNLFYLDQAAAS
ncbi:MAG: VOC family protein [Gammaproteobacteria bacterium]|nr:VOC family protein [Gammaproteobacteria bacterium]